MAHTETSEKSTSKSKQSAKKNDETKKTSQTAAPSEGAAGTDRKTKRASLPDPEEVKRAVKETAEKQVRAVVDVGRDAVERQRQSLSEEGRTLARALRDAGERVSDQAAYAPQLLTAVADTVESVVSAFAETDVDDVVRKAQTFAKERPAIFIGGAVFLGLVLGRFFKASGERSPSGGGLD